ncbi:MAG: hypothetical protein N2050_05980 [Flavobacteriales bacterium]|nr:hypothetical protein [Flavobacteriales bacterium]
MALLSRPGILVWMGLFTVLLALAVFPREMRKVFPQGPCPEVKLPDMPLGPRPENLKAFVHCAGPEGLKAYRRISLVWDSLFPLCYSLFFTGLAHRVLYRRPPVFPLPHLHFLALVSGGMDLMENVCIRQALTSSSGFWSEAALGLNVLKWGLAAVGLVLLALGLAYRLYKR